MADRRLPIRIKRQPGGFAIEFADGSPMLMVYGAEGKNAHAAKIRETEEAKALAQDIARALTALWQ